MDAEQIDGRVMAEITELIQENQQQLMQEMFSNEQSDQVPYYWLHA